MPSQRLHIRCLPAIIHFYLWNGRVHGNYFSQLFLVFDPKPRSAGNTGSKSKDSSKPSSKPTAPEANCDILCQLGKGAKDLWDSLSKGGKGGSLEDALKGGLDAPKLGVIG